MVVALFFAAMAYYQKQPARNRFRSYSPISPQGGTGERRMSVFSEYMSDPTKLLGKWWFPVLVTFLSYVVILVAIAILIPPAWRFWGNTVLCWMLLVFAPLFTLGIIRGGAAGKIGSVVLLAILFGALNYEVDKYEEREAPPDTRTVVRTLTLEEQIVRAKWEACVKHPKSAEASGLKSGCYPIKITIYSEGRIAMEAEDTGDPKAISYTWDKFNNKDEGMWKHKRPAGREERRGTWFLETNGDPLVSGFTGWSKDGRFQGILSTLTVKPIRSKG